MVIVIIINIKYVSLMMKLYEPRWMDLSDWCCDVAGGGVSNQCTNLNG